jgi:undecaprenyl-diphosphatase
MGFFEAIIIAIIEGITEFLPISSTGHMIITSSMMGIQSDEFTKAFTVIIQLGAILSVLVLYWKRFFQSFDFYWKLFLAFIPAAVFGLLFNDYIDALLESSITVAITLVLGGLYLLVVDRQFRANESKSVQIVRPKNAISIGFFQVIAMIPGVSRSAATIIGGLYNGFNRKQAAEFSFFLAVPTMFAATAYKLLKIKDSISTEQIDYLIVGSLVAFVVGMLAIKFFISFLTRRGFKIFGYYRIILGLTIIALYFLGIPLKVV